MADQDNKKFFEEKILYKTRQHWIIPTVKSIKYFFLIVLPISLFTYFASSFSIVWVLIVGILILVSIVAYIYYLWFHSWLMIGNQKVTLTIRNGIFSQYAMNLRYRNIRDCAVSKNSMFWYIFKYGSLFLRSSWAEWDFEAQFVPKVWKIYALVNALSRYNDDDRMSIATIEELHNHHHKNEFSSVDPAVERHW